MVETKCEVCGRTLPSEHWMRTATLCVDCFQTLPLERQEELSRTAATLAATAAERSPAAKPQFTWKTILGAIVGTVLGRYSKLNALIPVVTVGLCTWLLTKSLRGRRASVAKVAGALLGYALWVAFGLLAGLYLEVGLELVL